MRKDSFIILISEDIKGKGIEKLKSEYKVEFYPSLWKEPLKLREKIKGIDALIVRNQTQINSQLLQYADDLRVIGRVGAGVDNIDIPAATSKRIAVCNTPEENSISVAEFTMGLILALARKIPSADRSVKKGEWGRWQYSGMELYGKTLGILGMGKIGYRVAKRGKAFGLKIVACDEYLTEFSLQITECEARLLSLEEVLKKSDIVSIHLPFTKKTYHLIDYSKLCKMKKEAFLINTSRGRIVCERDLFRILKEGKIKGAALDVREEEPPGESPLHKLENVIFTPHIAAFTKEAQERVVSSAARDVDKVLRGKRPVHIVNEETLPLLNR